MKYASGSCDWQRDRPACETMQSICLFLARI